MNDKHEPSSYEALVKYFADARNDLEERVYKDIHHNRKEFIYNLYSQSKNDLTGAIVYAEIFEKYLEEHDEIKHLKISDGDRLEIYQVVKIIRQYLNLVDFSLQMLKVYRDNMDKTDFE